MFSAGVIHANESFYGFLSRMIPVPTWDHSFVHTPEQKTEQKRQALQNDAYETLDDYLDGSFNGFVRFKKYLLKINLNLNNDPGRRRLSLIT